jgi:uncharacterized DUF497 family protein
MEYVYSRHAAKQLEKRGITTQQVDEILQDPLQVLEEDDYTIYRAILKFGDADNLVRVFLNHLVSPCRIITVYKTSKITKYYEGEV